MATDCPLSLTKQKEVELIDSITYKMNKLKTSFTSQTGFHRLGFLINVTINQPIAKIQDGGRETHTHTEYSN